ncbi:hypothetical protein HOH87_01660 [bacterium]|nr:hypothetical protein [bacterium]
MMPLRSIIISVFIGVIGLGAISYAAAPSPFSGSFIERTTGPRPTSMGNAYRALSDDTYGIYLNPAGLAQVKDTQFKFMSYDTFETSYHSMEFVLGLGFQTWGFGIIGATVPEIPHTTFDTGTGRVVDTGDTSSYEANAVYLSNGFYFLPDLRLGFALKFINLTLFDKTGGGFGMDMGLQYDPFDFLTLGFTVENMVQPTIRWNTASSAEDVLPKIYTFGQALKLLDKRLIISTDIRYEDNNISSQSLDTITDSEGIESLVDSDVLVVGAGIEYRLIDSLALRAGISNGDLSYGAGLTLDALQFDFAYTLPRTSLTDLAEPITRFSTGLTF